MELTFACTDCSAVTRTPRVEAAPKAVCGSCRRSKEIRAASFTTNGLAACPLCATEDLYVQKDFPQNLGIAIVVVGFVVSSVFWYYERPLATYAILMASALLDMFLFYRVPTVTICYRCLSQIRGEGANPGERFKPFDLGVGERYRQERIRIQELRQREGSKGEVSEPSSLEP